MNYSHDFGAWRVRKAVLLAALWTAALPMGPLARASRPMVTDDARIVEHKGCQVESWIKRTRGGEEFWTLPACNPFGKLEVTLGGAVTRAQVAGHAAALQLQGKTVFKAVPSNGWGFGAAAGLTDHLHNGHHAADVYAYAPASFALRDERAVIHANLGWLHDGQAHQEAATWGLGTEIELSKQSWLIAENYGIQNGTPYYHFGLRHWIVRNRVQLDATYGNRYGSGFHSPERWISTGLRVLSPVKTH